MMPELGLSGSVLDSTGRGFRSLYRLNRRRHSCFHGPEKIRLNFVRHLLSLSVLNHVATHVSKTHRRRSLVGVIAAMAVVNLVYGITFPLLALVLDSQGISKTLIGLSTMSQALAILLVAPLAPRLLRRFAPARLMQKVDGDWQRVGAPLHEPELVHGDSERAVVVARAARGRDDTMYAAAYDPEGHEKWRRSARASRWKPVMNRVAASASAHVSLKGRP